MTLPMRQRVPIWRLCCLALCCLWLCACGSDAASTLTQAKGEDDYLAFLDVEPASADPQCILENYTVALNVFDRLVEVRGDNDALELEPSLADSWEVSEDGLRYSFHLREGVRYSNGAELTTDDVRYSFERLITNPASVHGDLVMGVVGAEELSEGKADSLAGFEVIDDHAFAITLAEPSAAFLASLSTPAASILDQETTHDAGDAFGHDVRKTVGTGPFVLEDWEEGKSIVMEANRECWSGSPACPGLKMLFYSESDALQEMFAQGKIDILDLDKLGMDAEYLLRGADHQRNIVKGRRVGITYIALNESQYPLGDVRVRKALQLALDRPALLRATADVEGRVENGILPTGLLGHNEELADIPFDPQQATELLAEAGFDDGFEMEVSYPLSAPQSVRDLLSLAASMWREIGIRVFVVGVAPDEFAERRSAGELTCYAATFSADYDDPKDFMQPFFGSAENSAARSLCYDDEDVMERVRLADAIVDEAWRIATYQQLEEKIVQQDAAWIPLYSRMHYFVVSDRVEGFSVHWNGWSSNRYADVALKTAGE